MTARWREADALPGGDADWTVPPAPKGQAADREPRDAETAATLAAVRGFDEALQRYDVDAVMAAMTEDCVFEN